MSDWKLIALDMDGTLLGSGGSISEENRKWIQKARQSGVEVTLATGRHIRTVQPYARGSKASVTCSNKQWERGMDN